MNDRGKYIASFYPYNSYANNHVELLTGLEKLRAIPDRELAGYLASIWDTLPVVKQNRSR
jgi:hypothetical protein